MLQTIERELDPFRNQAPELRRWRTPVERARCAELLDRCEALDDAAQHAAFTLFGPNRSMFQQVAIGSATGAYAKDDTALFVLHDAKSTALYLFTSKGNDAAVCANELVQMATRTGGATTGIDDYSLQVML